MNQYDRRFNLGIATNRQERARAAYRTARACYENFLNTRIEKYAVVAAQEEAYEITQGRYSDGTYIECLVHCASFELRFNNPACNHSYTDPLPGRNYSMRDIEVAACLFANMRLADPSYYRYGYTQDKDKRLQGEIEIRSRIEKLQLSAEAFKCLSLPVQDRIKKYKDLLPQETYEALKDLI